MIQRYNVRSKYVDGPVSWEYEAHDEGQIVFADSALTRIAELERTVAGLCEALKDVAEQKLPDGSLCWCQWTLDDPTHVECCEKARALLAEHAETKGE